MDLTATFLISMRYCLTIVTTFQKTFFYTVYSSRTSWEGCELDRDHCELRLENESSVSFSQCLCCELRHRSVSIDSHVGELLENHAGSLFCKEITTRNCNRSHLTVGSGFCLTTVHLFLDLVRQVQDRVGCESAREIVCFSLDRDTASR